MVNFYTEEGSRDLVGNNTLVLFIGDPYKFVDLIHSQQCHVRNNLHDATMQWHFWSHSPEAQDQVTILMPECGSPKTYCHMNGYCLRTDSLINGVGARDWLKFRSKTAQWDQTIRDGGVGQIIGRDW